MHIVLVEDNVVLAKSITRVLKQEGYGVTHHTDGDLALTWLGHNLQAVDLVILDILLPSLDGFSLCEALRKEQAAFPILMLTSKTELEDIIQGITLGADDYLKKPFAMEELLVRIEALLRRPAAATPLHFEVTPDVVIDMSSHKVSRSDKKPVVLTAKEFGILAYFINHKNKVITQQELYDHVFDFADVQLSNSIEVHIKNVRKKLRTEHYDIPLTTIRGAGYRFDYE